MLRSALTAIVTVFLFTAQASAQLRSTGSQTWSQGTNGVAGAEEAGDRVGEALASGDFNNDGFDDLAMGAPRESVGSEEMAGAVNVLYGGAGGLAVAGNQIWSQNSTDIDGEAEANDQFGSSLAACDFNGDGFDDLAIGVSGENDSAGAVQIIFGAPGGLEAAGNQSWSQGSPGIQGVVEDGDQFGFSLACADIDADGFADLATGLPAESVGELANAGAVNVIYGSAAGLTAAGDQIFTQDTAGIGGVAQAGDQFGFSLTFGDFNNDMYPDLALGVPGQNLGEFFDAGEVIILMGTSSGLTAEGDLRLRQGPMFAGGALGPGDFFGISLAAGDFNNDGFDDLAIGASGEDIDGANGAGALNVVYGSAGGIVAAGAQFWHQDSPRFPDAAESSDAFGRTLATADFDNDGFSDLAVGVFGEDLDTIINAGITQVLHGRPGGLAVPAQTWSQDSAGIDDEAQDFDNFGDALATGDFNRDGFGDLAIAASRENAGSVQDTGLVHVIYGGPPSTRSADLSRQRRALGGVTSRLQALFDLLP